MAVVKTRLAAFAAAVLVAFGAAYVVGDSVDPIVEDEPTINADGFGHDHEEHSP